MPEVIRYVFCGEGGSDEALMSPISELIASIDGITEVSGVAISTSEIRSEGFENAASVGTKIRAALHFEPNANLILVHRDSDNVGYDSRKTEVLNAAIAENAESMVAPVIAIRATEAWALLDEQLIRRAVGKPNGTTDLQLPKKSEVEAIADPKNVLKEAFRIASEATGRRLKKINRSFGKNRSFVLSSIDIEGSIKDLVGWQRFRVAVESKVQDNESVQV